MNRYKALFLSVFLAFSVCSLFSQPSIGPRAEVGIEENLNGYIPDQLKLVNENGDTVILNRLLDKPTVLSLVYYRCPGICSPLMEGIAEVIDQTDLKLGKDYQVFTVSFDPREPYHLAVSKKKNYLNRMQKKALAQEHWKFFVGDSASVAELTDSVGFKYKRTGNDFVHSASLIMISESGKITRYLNGTYFLPFEFKMAILETSKGKAGPTINKVLQYCYSYDPTGQKYVLNITRVVGILTIIVAVVIFLILTIPPIIKKRKRQKQGKE
jgi:protein SCO1/2